MFLRTLLIIQMQPGGRGQGTPGCWARGLPPEEQDRGGWQRDPERPAVKTQHPGWGPSLSL